MKFFAIVFVILSIAAAVYGVPKVSSKNSIDMYIPTDSEVYLD